MNEEAPLEPGGAESLAATLKAAARAGVDDGPAARRLGAFAERLAGVRRVYHQAPQLFHYPGLPEIEFHDREAFPWLGELEAATAGIRAELEAILAEDGDELAPYVDFPPGAPLGPWGELNGSQAWGAFHLIFDGRVVPWNAGRCPRTMEALARLPQPRVPGRSPMATFSVLRPGTHIPPHTGVANTRLIVHLPLITPEGCRLRVGAETREWRTGEAFVFDDTIEHEAWNDSDRTRSVLICDVWRPELSAAERQGIVAVSAAIDREAAAQRGTNASGPG